jgi:hypothetical protein
MKRFRLSLLVALVLTLFVVTPVFADGGHVYGVVFMDENGNGVWDDEPGVADVAVHFVQADTDIVLYSAWNDNDDDVGPDMYCTHFRDEAFGDDVTHWKIPKGCNGTFGLIGGVEGTWKVYIDVPAGYKLTTPGSADYPYFADTLMADQDWTDGTDWLEFGLMPAAAGAQMPDYDSADVFVVTGVEDRWVAENTAAGAPAGISLAGPYKAAVPE